MADTSEVLRRVSWRDLFPWLLLVRAFSISISVRVLLLAALAALATSGGWVAAKYALFSKEERARIDAAGQIESQLAAWPGARVGTGWRETAPDVPRLGEWFKYVPAEPVYSVWRRLSEPFRLLFDSQRTFRQLAYVFSGGLWTLAVWSLLGGAITRIATVELGREERTGLRVASAFALHKWGAYFTAPLLPLAGMLLCALPLIVLGWVMLLDVGMVLGGLLWGGAILFGFIAAILGLGLLFGWPLMWPTISAEGSDAFDALSRSYGYTFQRPLRYLFYAVVAAMIGALGWVVVLVFAELVIGLTHWGVAWGAGVERVGSDVVAEVAQGDAGLLIDGRLVPMPGSPDAEASGMYRFGCRAVVFWNGVVRMIATAYSYAFFFVAMSGIYLLLRHDVDETETDEVYLEEEEELYGMPPLENDEAGVPRAADAPPESGAPSQPPPIPPQNPSNGEN